MFIIAPAECFPEAQIGREPTQQQNLLALAEQTWGPQFREDNSHAWWCTSEIPGGNPGVFSAVTNGEQYFVSSPIGGYLEITESNSGNVQVSKLRRYNFEKSRLRRIPLSWLT